MKTLLGSQAPLCGSFVLQQAPSPGRTKYEAAAGPRCSAAAPRARCSCLWGLHDPLLRPLLRSPRASSSAIAPLSGTADDDTIGGDGVGKPGDKPPGADSDFDSDETGGVGTATGRAAVSTDVATETRRLMSVPTIDIKLELQMRGVEHRDAFEKADLARRLAEARVSCCGNNPSPSHDDDDASTATTKAAGRNLGGAAAHGPRESAHRSNKASTTTGNEPQAAAATAVPTEGRGAASDGCSSSAYARDVARGTRMGKAALARELNGMGIAHSRLSDVSVLARQYAARRQEAREDARRFPPSSALDGSISSAEEDGEGGGEGRQEDKKGSGRRRGGGEKEDGDDVSDDGGSETGWSTRANAGSAATAGGGGGGGGGDMERSRKAALHARADRLSSRELMKALDALGAQYRIPAPRAELQQAFVSAVLAAEEDERSQADATAAASGSRGENIVPVSPYDAPLEEGDGGLRGTQGFGTYHSALRWARQLNFDDVLDELKYRGVEHSPRADYSYLTRLLADEVLADEELMGGEGGPEGADAYTAELEAAMSMSAQEMIRDLRAGGEIADVTLSKEALAERLAEMKLRLRGEPLPHSGSSAAYYYRESPPPPQGRARGGGGGGGGGSTEGREPADPLGRRDGDGDVLLELEEAAKSVGGAALLVAREAAAFVSETAAGFFPPPPADDNNGGRSASPSAAGRRGQGAGGGGGGGGGGAQETERSRQVRAARERAGGVRRAATGYAQSSVNRAGFAVLQSLANGLLRGAEAAADWAGDGALAREYVLLFIAAFCLVFKRGVGAAVALLVVIRFGRIAAQKLVLEGWKMERAKRRRATEGGGGGGRSSTAAAVGGGGATASRRFTSGYTAAPAGRHRRRRPRPQTETETETRRPRPKDAREKKGKGPGSARSRRTKKPARKPLWEESDDDDRGCVVM
ncbi:unnamed protein product [Ectocarpus sp. CCAP 1310/34]|nr:unnamed protein product [Ectocarpus sp. CCAP 1310/34]